MENITVKVEMNLIITAEDIDDIMVAALEGGITYWCRKVDVEGKFLGEYASDQISRGGLLKIYEGENSHVLDKEKLINGILQYIKEPVASDFLEQVDHELRIDTCYVDAEVADAIIQYALFGEVVYG